jgi:hypothetical protein
MGINFPNAPTTGQLYPQPPVAGLPIYRWDGTKWTTQGGTVGQPIYISDTAPTGAPAGSLWWESDTGVLYIYYNDGDSMQWVPATPYPDLNAYLLKSGGTLTGPLTLAADPAAPLQAATMEYVDARALRTRTVLTSGSGTYNTKANCKAINVRMVGGGGGGCAGGTGGNGGAAGTASTFGPLTAGAGAGSVTSGGGAGGTASGGDDNQTGGIGGGGNATSSAGAVSGGSGGQGFRGGGGTNGTGQIGPQGGQPNSGGGGGGGCSTVTGQASGGGGGAGGYLEKLIVPPAASYAYAVGGGGAGGTIGTGAQAGANGGSGIIIVDEYY